MMNSCNFAGRLVADPKMYEGESNRATFTLAVDGDVPSDEAVYLDFVAWRDKANYIARRFHKGDLMLVVNAKANVRNIEKDGKKSRKIEFEVGKAYCVSRHREENDER